MACLDEDSMEKVMEGLLKYVIGREVTKTELEYSWDFFCPSCHKKVSPSLENYCSNCGQKLLPYHTEDKRWD